MYTNLHNTKNITDILPAFISRVLIAGNKPVILSLLYVANLHTSQIVTKCCKLYTETAQNCIGYVTGFFISKVLIVGYKPVTLSLLYVANLYTSLLVTKCCKLYTKMAKNCIVYDGNSLLD